MNNSIKAFWASSSRIKNFGDVLNPWLIEKISGHPVVRVKPGTEGVVLCIGSIISVAKAGTVVWGSGIMYTDDKIDPAVNIYAVRGPLTRQAILANGGKCPEVYGDPALLMPLFFIPKIEKQYELGIIPHYIDFNHVCKCWSGIRNILIIDIIYSNILEIIKQICSCKHIVSSSLHGLIIGQTYGIPSLWVEFSDKVKGAGIKFHDYLLSTNQLLYEPIQLRGEQTSIYELINCIPPARINFDFRSLLNSCPFKK